MTVKFEDGQEIQMRLDVNKSENSIVEYLKKYYEL